MIEYRQLYKAFDRPVLEGIDLTVAAGELLGIVGPSGSGKSVLLKMTIGLIVPDRGDVIVDGQSVFEASSQALRAIRGRVGYVFQSAALFDSQTVFENVALGLHEADGGKPDPELLAESVGRALKAVNLDPAAVSGKLPSELSGGMARRVGLARALVGQPSILLYDDPTAGLDPVNAASIASVVARMNRRRGATSVMVTHDMKAALGLCHRVALLHGGRMRFVGTPDEFRRCEDPLVRAFTDRSLAASLSLRELERRLPA